MCQYTKIEKPEDFQDLLMNPNISGVFDKSQTGIALYRPNAECVYMNGPLKNLLMTREDSQIVA